MSQLKYRFKKYLDSRHYRYKIPDFSYPLFSILQIILYNINEYVQIKEKISSSKKGALSQTYHFEIYDFENALSKISLKFIRICS